jgi:hypothetical protein
LSDEDTFITVIATHDGARQKFIQAMTHAKSILDNGERVELRVGPALDTITLKQRGFLHASVLPQIAEQVWITNPGSGKRERFVSEVWKEHMHRLFLPDKWVMRQLPGAKKKTPHRERVSSEQLGVKRYSQWIDSIIDYAVVELNVQFVFKPSEREGARYVAKPRKEKQQ